MPRRGKSAAVLAIRVFACMVVLGVAACATNDVPAGDPGSFKPYIGGQLGVTFGQSIR